MKKFFIFLIPVCVVVALALYIFNPSGTASLDPRARILGIVPYHVPAESMSPTIRKGDYIVASSYAYASAEPKHREVITFHHPNNPKTIYVKRIVGVPGDIITVRDHVLFINGEVQEERFIQHSRRGKPFMNGSWEVPEHSYFVMGDNRDNSSDSRLWGPVPRSHIIGRVSYVWFSNQDNSGPIE